MANEKYTYTPSRANRIGTGLANIGQGLAGFGDAVKQGKENAYDTMAETKNLALQDQNSRANKYADRNADMYMKLGNRANLFRNNSQENSRANMLREYLGKYGGTIGNLSRYVPSQSDLQKRQLEDLRTQTFMDSTYLPTDMFNEYYGSEGQSNLGQELGLPMNGMMQSGVSGGRGNNAQMNSEFNNDITNSSALINAIQNELAKKAHEQSSMSGLQKMGLTSSLIGAILGMAKPGLPGVTG